MKPVVILAAVVAVAVLVPSVFFASQAHKALTEIPRSDMIPSAEPGEPVEPETPAEQGAVDILLMGSDRRGDEQGRSDSLMLVHVNQTRDRVWLISFPRDMYVPIPGYGKNKINAAYSFGGPKLAVKTLNKMLGIHIDHAADVDMEGFLTLSDTLGGITVNNKYASSNLGFDFAKGKIELSGDALLAYVRQRKGLPQGDLSRAERQRAVVAAMLAKIASVGTLTNPTAVMDLAGRVGQTVTVDSGLGESEILGLATSLRLGDDAVTDLQAPILGYDRTAAGAAIDVVDWPGIERLGKAIRTDSLESLDKP